jgi:hypothetical protein
MNQGNQKLRSNESIQFYCWNIPAIITCPFSTELCRNNCYANKIEKQYPATLERNEYNLEATEKVSFVSDMIDFFKAMLAKKSNTDKTIIVRIHESGDFYSLKYMWKWCRIAMYFLGDSRIIFQAYTKSLKYIEDCISFLPEGERYIENLNIHFTSSIWSDTSDEASELTKKLDLQVYTAFDKITMLDNVANNGFYECECIDCGKCTECYKDNYKKIAVKIH